MENEIENKEEENVKSERKTEINNNEEEKTTDQNIALEKTEPETDEKEKEDEEDKIKAHIESLRKLKSNQQIDLKRGDEIRKNICIYVRDQLPLKRKGETIKKLTQKISFNLFNLYFPKYADSYSHVPKVLFLLNGDIDDILIALKYLIENIDKINFLVYRCLLKLKKKKHVKDNQVIAYLIDFALKKLCENNLNYRYKKTFFLDFFDNLMIDNVTFFETGIMNEAIDIKDLRLLYFYKHSIKMKEENKFITKAHAVHTEKNSNSFLEQHRNIWEELKAEDSILKTDFLIKNINYQKYDKYFLDNQEQIDGELPIPNKCLGVFECLEEQSIFEKEKQSIDSEKKGWFEEFEECIQKYIKNKKKCKENEEDLCKCVSNIIVNVNGDAKLREKINMARKEVKLIKNVLMKIRKIELIVEKFIQHDEENILMTNEKTEEKESDEESDSESETESKINNRNENIKTEENKQTIQENEQTICVKERDNKEEEEEEEEETLTEYSEMKSSNEIIKKRKYSDTGKSQTDMEEEEESKTQPMKQQKKCELKELKKRTFSDLYDSEEEKEFLKEQNENSEDCKSETIKTFFFEELDYNFILLGSVKKGSDRHKALLFKVLLDSVDIPCRFVRIVLNKRVHYFNMVLLPSVPNEDTIESIIPIFWGKENCIKEKLSPNFKITITNFIKDIHINFNYIDNFFLRVWKNNKESLNLGDIFEFKKKLGAGGFGEVWMVQFKESTQEVDSMFFSSIKKTSTFALKLVDFNEFNLNESVILREKSHANVIQLYCVFKGYQILKNRQEVEEKNESICFLIQLANTSLEKIFIDDTVAYNMNFTRIVLLEIANVMAHIHKPNHKRQFFIYRDLKPDNILIKDKEILLTDFNLSRKMDEDFEYFMSQCCGTKGHLAPEQKSVAYDRNVDIWAYSIIIAKFLKHKNFNYLSHPQYNINLKHFEIQDKFLINLFLNCVDENPFMRPTFEEIIKLLVNEIIRKELETSVRTRTIEDFEKNEESS